MNRIVLPVLPESDSLFPSGDAEDIKEFLEVTAWCDYYSGALREKGIVYWATLDQAHNEPIVRIYYEGNDPLAFMIVSNAGRIAESRNSLQESAKWDLSEYSTTLLIPGLPVLRYGSYPCYEIALKEYKMPVVLIPLDYEPKAPFNAIDTTIYSVCIFVDTVLNKVELGGGYRGFQHTDVQDISYSYSLPQLGDATKATTISVRMPFGYANPHHWNQDNTSLFLQYEAWRLAYLTKAATWNEAMDYLDMSSRLDAAGSKWLDKSKRSIDTVFALPFFSAINKGNNFNRVVTVYFNYAAKDPDMLLLVARKNIKVMIGQQGKAGRKVPPVVQGDFQAVGRLTNGGMAVGKSLIPYRALTAANNVDPEGNGVFFLGYTKCYALPQNASGCVLVACYKLPMDKGENQSWLLFSNLYSMEIRHG